MKVKPKQKLSDDLRQQFAATARELAGGNSKLRRSLNRWLVERYSHRRWLPEDNNRAYKYLAAFVAHRDELTATQRDLFRHGDLPQLFSTVKSHLEQDQKETPPPARPSDMLWFYQSEKLKFGMPRSMAAAQQYGANTEWCVASTSDNYFWHYAAKNPVLYILTDDGQKYCWVAGAGQFRNAADDPLSEAEAAKLLANHPQLPELLGAWAQHLHHNDFEITLDELPPQLIIEATYLAVVKQNGISLKDIPIDKHTDALYLAAVTNKGLAVHYVPEDKRSEAIYLAAVSEDGRVLAHLPKNQFTDDFYQQLYLVAVTKKGSVLEFVPTDRCSDAMRLAAVTNDGLALYHVPEDKRTTEICLAAVSQNGRALEYVPQNKFTDEFYQQLYLAAVTSKEWALEYVPENKRSETLCLLAVTNYGLSLQDVSEDKRTAEICLAAVSQNGKALTHVSENKFTDEFYQQLYLAAVTNNGSALEQVPEDKRSEEIYLAAVTNNGRMLAYVPEDKRNAEICLSAVARNAESLKFVPEDNCSEEIYLTAAMDKIEHIPTFILSEDFCHKLIAKAVNDNLPAGKMNELISDMCLFSGQAGHKIDYDNTLRELGWAIAPNGKFAPPTSSEFIAPAFAASALIAA
jgi:hypothetical protein